MFRPSLVLLLTSLTCASALAQEAATVAAPKETLAQKEFWANQMDYTQRTLDSIASTCGGSISFTYHKPSWWAAKDELAAGATSPNGRCDDVLNAIVNTCWNDAEVSAIVLANVKSVECGYGGMDSGFRLDLKAGHLRYDVEVNRPNIGEEVEGWLKSQM